MYVVLLSDTLIPAYSSPVSFLVSTLTILSVHSAFQKKVTLSSLIFSSYLRYTFYVPKACYQVLFFMYEFLKNPLCSQLRSVRII